MDLTLQTTLASILQSLATFFGTSIEYINEHAVEYLAKYGWYSLVSGASFDIFFGALIGGLLCILIFGVFEYDTDSPILVFFIAWFVAFMVLFLPSLISCAIAPEFYGAQALINALQ